MSTRGEPVWALAAYFPSQGDWDEAEYLAFPREGAHLEFEDGFIEVLPMPTERHQAMLEVLFLVLRAYAVADGGRVHTAGLRVRLRPGLFREPDLVFLSKARLHLRGPEFWSGADLVVEVVGGSPNDRVRDLVKKRREYAAAGIPEYWLVDPETETLTVLRLDAGGYVEHGVFRRGESATSAAFAGLAADVTAVLDAD